MEHKYEKKHDQKEEKTPSSFSYSIVSAKPEVPIIQSLHELAIELNPDSKANIILQGLNLSDGIGDFEHLLDYFNWCKETFPKSAIKGITFVSTSKLEIAKRILPQSLVDHCYICENYLAFDPEKAKNASIIIFSGNFQLEQELDRCLATIKKLPFFGTLTKNTNTLLNISTSLFQSKGGFLDCMPPTCLNHSILEYDGNPSSGIKGLPPFSEVAMGVGENQVGIKLNKAIQGYTKLSPQDKISLLKTLHNQNLLASLIDDLSIDESTIENYLSHTKLCMGYLQKISGKGYLGTEVFIESMAKVHGGKFNLDIMVEKGYLEELQKSAGGLNKLLEQGFSQIQLMDNTGRIIKVHPEDVHGGGKKLRLIQFSGITQEDKEKLFCITEAATGSGDNSFAAVVAARAFPFFAMPTWKDMFMKSLINLASHEQMKTLATYLNLLGKETGGLSEFIQGNYHTIQREWQHFCDIIETKYNAKNYFTQLAANYWFKEIVQSAESNDITSFTTAVKPFILAGLPIFIPPSEKAKATTFLDAIYLHQGLILEQTPAHPQHLDLLLHAAVIENDLSLCQKLYTLGAKPILDKTMLSLLDPGDACNVFQLALANIQEDPMHGTLTWLFANYPDLAPPALAMTNAHNQNFLEATMAQNASFNFLTPYAYTYDKLLSDKGINCFRVTAEDNGTLRIKFENRTEYVKALGKFEKINLLNVHPHDKELTLSVKKDLVDSFLSDKTAKLTAAVVKHFTEQGYNAKSSEDSVEIIFKASDNAGENEKAAREFKEKLSKTFNIPRLQIKLGENSDETTYTVSITEKNVEKIANQLSSNSEPLSQLSTSLNIGKKSFY